MSNLSRRNFVKGAGLASAAVAASAATVPALADEATAALHNAERERDTVAAENALLQKRLESKDQDVTNALRDEDGFIRLEERNGKND